MVSLTTTTTPISLQLSFVPLPYELGCAVSGAALCLQPNPGALCVAGMYRVAFLGSSLSCSGGDALQVGQGSTLATQVSHHRFGFILKETWGAWVA